VDLFLEKIYLISTEFLILELKNRDPMTLIKPLDLKLKNPSALCLCLLTMISFLFPLKMVAAETKVKHYNITASHKHRFMWFRVAKVGTRSILDLILSNFPVAINAYDVPYETLKYQDYFKFAFVRNPWDRVVSCYCNKVLKGSHEGFKECFGKSFEYFVDYIDRQNLNKSDVHIQLQSRLFPHKDVDFIGHFENFEEDVHYVFSRLGIENISIPQKNSSHHNHYSHYYNKKTRKIIEKKYKEDIVRFGYRFESAKKDSSI
jgi:hypothetical protein